MADILQFTPMAELDASENLRGFIEGCRKQLTVFGSDLDWNANTWDVATYLVRRGCRGKLAFVFSDFKTAGSKKESKPMSQPFLDFAKSYMRYQHAMRPMMCFGMRLVALRALEKALVELSADGVPRIARTDPHVLNYAVQLIQKRTPGSAYQVANQLKVLADLLVRFRFTAFAFTWKNPIRRPSDHNIRVGTKAAKRRNAKLPSNEILDALAQAYKLAVEPRDVIITSIAALMMCSPDRINEVFRLPINCEHETTFEGSDIYGLRWWPAKGADPMIKWIIKSMVETAKDAIQRLREQSKEARRMALWYENNPGQLYLPSGLEHLRCNEQLSSKELCELVGISSTSNASKWAQGHGIKYELVPRRPHVSGGNSYSYAFKDIEEVIVSMLPQGFPIHDNETGLRHSNTLLLFPKNLFHPNRPSYKCMFEILITGTVNCQLGSGIAQGKSSIFSRLGLTDENNNPFKITSHQFRHWLNTLAQQKNLDQMTIALWSGRKNVSQNSAYDHRTTEDVLKLLRQCDTSELSGVMLKIASHTPMTREEFMELKYPTVHTTPYGFCVHDWSMIPCQKHRACIDCTKHKCIKGDMNKTERVRQCLRDAEEQLERDEQAVADGFIGADRWLKLNRKRVERLRNLVEIFDDPTIPEGMLIEITNENEYSPIKLAVDERQLLGDKDAMMLRQCRSLKGVSSSLAE